MRTLGDLIDEGIHAKREAVRVIVTPECAKRALGFNTRNRHARKTNVEYLASMMKTGQWRDDHSHGIVFSNTSRLIDGQHRLMAVVASERPAIMRVDTGCDDTMHQHIDSHVPRAMCDRVSFADDKALNKQVTMVIVAYVRIKTQMSKKRPASFIEQVYANWEDEATFVGKFVHENRGKLACQFVLRSCVNAAVMEALRMDKQRAMSFLMSVAFPDGDCQPGRMMREWMLRNKLSSGMAQELNQYRVAWSALDAALSGRDIKFLRPLSREMIHIGYPLQLEVK